jgi:hypothetical protein
MRVPAQLGAGRTILRSKISSALVDILWLSWLAWGGVLSARQAAKGQTVLLNRFLLNRYFILSGFF